MSGGQYTLLDALAHLRSLAWKSHTANVQIRVTRNAIVAVRKSLLVCTCVCVCVCVCDSTGAPRQGSRERRWDEMMQRRGQVNSPGGQQAQ